MKRMSQLRTSNDLRKEASMRVIKECPNSYGYSMKFPILLASKIMAFWQKYAHIWHREDRIYTNSMRRVLKG